MATVFKIKTPNPGIWFKFDESDPDSGKIRIRPLTPKQMLEMRKKTVKRKVEYKHRQRFEYEEHDEETFSLMLWDYVIAEWEGLEDEDGEPIECTVENKYSLMMENVGFAQFVAQCRDKANDELTKQQEEEEGN